MDAFFGLILFGVIILGFAIWMFYTWVVDKIREPVEKELDLAKKKIDSLEKELSSTCASLEKCSDELKFCKGLIDSSDSYLKSIPYMAQIVADVEAYGVTQLANPYKYNYARNQERLESLSAIRGEAKKKIEQYKIYEYQLAYIFLLHPELRQEFSGVTGEKEIVLNQDLNVLKNSLEKKYNLKAEELRGVYENKLKQALIQFQADYDKRLKQLIDSSKSNLRIIPYMAAVISDLDTIDIAALADRLDWGISEERAKKVKSIREIRKDTQNILEQYKWAEYQLKYLLELYPVLQDVIETEFNQLPKVEIKDASELEEYDSVRDYLSKEEYKSLSTTEKNQLALDRYVESHRKTKWQIGRDYELYCGYKYSQKGYEIDYFGSFMGLEDLGRDLICKKKGAPTLIIQCKYWSQIKTIHEKHITQLYGTKVSYCIENNLSPENVNAILITNITVSPMASKMAKHLNVEIVERYELKEYPRIKCNINVSPEGRKTKIYHLPFDQQYDSTKIDKEGEFFALTVAEAEAAGFRRAFRHFV